MSRAPLRAGLLGGGTVGGAVARAFAEFPARLAPADGAQLVLAAIAVRDLTAALARGLPAELLTDAPAHLVASPEVDVVVELFGGDEPARTLIAAALGAGKPVVTANKHVIAHDGPELELLARRTGAPLRFEAAVGGGIPILGLIAADLAANEVHRVRGIVNGTTNHILTAMAEDGVSYEAALADAQARGYAEADPSGDVEGADAVNKLVILARLAFGAWLDPDAVVRRPPTVLGLGRPGITGVSAAEMAAASALGLTIRLLAWAGREGHGAERPFATEGPPPAGAIDPDGALGAAAQPIAAAEPIAAAVLPTGVPSASPLGATGGVLNQVEIEATPVGTIRIAGPGAGGDPTSSAVLGDLIAIARGQGSTWAGLPPSRAGRPAPISPLGGRRRWFALLPDAATPPGLGAAAEGARSVPVAGGTAVLTGPMTLEELRAAARALLPPGVDVTLYPVDD